MTPSIYDLFRQLPKSTLDRLSQKLGRLVPSSGLTYQDERGKTTSITVTLRPRLVPAGIRNALWKTLRVLDGAFQKIAPLYFQNPSLAPIFPFSRREVDWLSLIRKKGYVKGPLVCRWDANTTFGPREWKEGFSFFEVNGVGVGALWYGPATEDVILKTVVPELQKIDRRFRPRPNHDMRRLLLGVLLAQRRKLGRTRGVIALAMEKASGSNYVEFERLAQLYRKLGHATIVTEPTDFCLRDGDLFAHRKKIDVIYRDTTLSELCLMEEKGHNLAALELAFLRGQVVSSLEGEFDHKSAFEVFTSPEFAPAFTPEERKLFKRHILWTRLLRERRTINPQGRSVDLIPFVLKNQSNLVLKPNRLYGGQGVAFGVELTRRAWEIKIETALRESGEWVIQQLGKLRKKTFFRPDGLRARQKDLYVVSGFFASPEGLGIVGRMSERKVVNVARRGGLTPILVTP